MSLVPVELYRIRQDDRRGAQLIVLRDRANRRLLHIVIGPFEAEAIRSRVAGVDTIRPMTHDLLANVIHELGCKLSRVNIDRLLDHTFYAHLIVEKDDGTVVEIDSRPSDAIALAVRTGAPLFVEEEVMAEAAVPEEAG